jgi:hypothetical protein
MLVANVSYCVQNAQKVLLSASRIINQIGYPQSRNSIAKIATAEQALPELPGSPLELWFEPPIARHFDMEVLCGLKLKVALVNELPVFYLVLVVGEWQLSGLETLVVGDLCP